MGPELRFAAEHADRFVEDLSVALRIPSISARGENAADLRRCADHLAAEMRRVGLTHAEVIPTAGHPVVYGEWLGAPGKPTVLIYGHYDVQPVDPENLWHTAPFEPTVRDGKLFARGSVDDKGQVYIHLAAIECYLRSPGGPGSLPINIKMIVEGEEEIGSLHLGEFLAAERARLDADIVVVSDTAMFAKDVPSLCYGLRGLAYCEIEVHGPAGDVHSGSFGGGINNPINALAHIVASLKDTDGRIRVDGFYDTVRVNSEAEKAEMASLPFDEPTWLAATGAPAAFGEPGFTTLERLWTRPTLDVNGILGGYTGEGAKTIIPSWARAKVSMRLVPHQDPHEILRLVEEHVRRVAPPSVRVTVTPMEGAPAWLCEPTHPAFDAAKRALEEGFGTRTVMMREGGSIPFVGTIADALGAPCLLLGFGLPDENSHAPNEWLDLSNFHRGIHSTVVLYRELASTPTAT